MIKCLSSKNGRMLDLFVLRDDSVYVTHSWICRIMKNILNDREMDLFWQKGCHSFRVQPGSVGEEIGIERGDIIISINGRPINDILIIAIWQMTVFGGSPG